MRLLLEAGNSTIKAALAHDGGIWSHARLPPEEPALASFAADHLRGLDELVLLPTASAPAALVRAWWRRVGAGRALREVGDALALPDLGQYAACGADRVLAGLVAVRQEGSSVIVVDAGTATTLSAWHATASGARFAGGLIAPGPRAWAAGLHACAPALPEAPALAADADPRQHSTLGAIGAAIGIGHPGAITACLARLQAATGIARAIITGGDAQALIAGGVLPRLAYRPTLVLEGLEELVRVRAQR